MGNRSRYHRQTDLFVPGTELVLDADVDPPLVMWLQKLNSFELGEATTEANVARARLLLALDRSDSDEVAVLESSLKAMSKDDLVETIVQYHYGDHFAQVHRALQADPVWIDKLDIVARSSGDFASLPEAEQRVVVDIDADYYREFADRQRKLEGADRDELSRLDVEDLRRTARKAFIDSRGTAAYTREMQVFEVLFGARVCCAVRKEDDAGWDHGQCDGHKERVYESREEVKALPDGMRDLIRDAFVGLTMTMQQAKGSARRLSSSAPSRPPSEEEASRPSTPGATSPEPATT